MPQNCLKSLTVEQRHWSDYKDIWQARWWESTSASMGAPKKKWPVPSRMKKSLIERAMFELYLQRWIEVFQLKKKCGKSEKFSPGDRYQLWTIIWLKNLSPAAQRRLFGFMCLARAWLSRIQRSGVTLISFFLHFWHSEDMYKVPLVVRKAISVLKSVVVDRLSIPRLVSALWVCWLWGDNSINSSNIFLISGLKSELYALKMNCQRWPPEFLFSPCDSFVSTPFPILNPFWFEIPN